MVLLYVKAYWYLQKAVSAPPLSFSLLQSCAILITSEYHSCFLYCFTKSQLLRLEVLEVLNINYVLPWEGTLFSAAQISFP